MAHQAAEDKALLVVCDDTYAFTLPLYFRYHGAISAGKICMKSPLEARAIIDNDATVHDNLSIIPGILAANAFSGCDMVASYYGIGKGTVLKILQAGNLFSYV